MWDILTVAGLSRVRPVLALLLFGAAVMLNLGPDLWARFRARFTGGKVMRMIGSDSVAAVLSATALAGSAVFSSVVANAVSG